MKHGSTSLQRVAVVYTRSCQEERSFQQEICTYTEEICTYTARNLYVHCRKSVRTRKLTCLRNGHNYVKKEPQNLANLSFFPCIIAYVIFANFAESSWALAPLISIFRKNARVVTPQNMGFWFTSCLTDFCKTTINKVMSFQKLQH